VTQYDCHHVRCTCGVTTCGAPPPGTPPGLLGPRVLALCGLVVADCNVSRRKVRELLHHLLGIRVSLGALSESEEITNDAVAPAVDEARLHALGERVKHVDATSWSCAGAYRCLWTMATAAVTVFFIATDGTRATLETWISKVRGVLVTDRGTQFGFWAMERRQICWAHLLRKFASFATRTGDAGKVGDYLLLWTRVLFHSWHRVRAGTMTRREFRAHAGRLREVIERLLEQGTATPGIAGSCVDILEHRAALWRFVDDAGVDPTNNHAEREIRGFVLWRKTSYGSRSERGDAFAANLKSVVHTCRKQGRPVLPYLTAAIQALLHGKAAPSLVVNR
jgi:transposase